MGTVQPPTGCMHSLEKCIEALCLEKSKNTSGISWLQRMSEWSTLSQLDENLANDAAQASWYEQEGPVWGSTQYRQTRWASDNTFSEASNHKYASPEQKGLLRQKIAQNYLDDHPDDCRPPPSVPRSMPLPAPQQLRLFDWTSDTLSKRAPLSDEGPQLPWWNTGAWAVLGIAITVADKTAAAASTVGNLLAGGIVATESVVLSCAGISLRYLASTFDQREPDIL